MLNRKHLAPLVLLTLLYGCGGAQPDLKAKEYKGRLEDKALQLSFQCPEKWEVRENVMGHRAIARSPLESPTDDFQENMVVTGPLKGTLAEVRSHCESEFKKLKDYQTLPSPSDILDFDHQRDGLKLHCRAYLQARPGGDFWMVSFTSTAADFPRHEAEFVAIMATFGKPLPPLTPSPTPALSGSATPAATPVATATPTAEATPGSGTPTPAAVDSATPTPAHTATPGGPTPATTPH
jgi:hypothetical protein